MRAEARRLLYPALVGAALVAGLAGAALAGLPEDGRVVSQRGKRFGPQDVGLHPGERITIVNDDGDLVHHAYVDAPELAYDSGDIEPGGRAVIVFPRTGDFTVLCGIHPRMKLTVRVQ